MVNLNDEVKKGQDYESILGIFNNELGDEAKMLLKTLIVLRNEGNETFS